MISLRRKRLLKSQAVSGVAAVRKTEAVSRTTQVAHSTVAVGDADVPVVDVASDATTAAAELPAVQDEVAQAATDSYEAALVAGEAQVSADGKSTVVRSTSAATAAGSYKEGDQWWQFSGANVLGLWLHSGTDWVPQVLTNAIIATLDAGKITTGVLAADRIGALSITTAKLAATAIDGMTVTGATLRTAASGQRMQFDVNGMRAFNAAGTVVANLKAGSSGFDLLPSASTGPYLRMWPSIMEFVEQATSAKRAHYAATGYWIEPPASAGTSSGCRNVGGPSAIDIYRDYTHSGGFAVSHFATMRAYGDSPFMGIYGATPAGSASAFFEIAYGPTGIPSSSAEADKVWTKELQRRGAGSIEVKSPVIFTQPVVFFGDTDWVYPTLIGGTNIVGNEFGFCKLNGVVWLTGRVNSGDGVTIYQMPAGFRIRGGADNVRLLDRGGPVRVNFKGTGHIEVLTGGLTGGGVSFAGTSYLAAPA